MNAEETIKRVELGGLRGMRFYAESGDEYVWTGRNHTVNIYNAGQEYDVMSVGDFSKDSASMDEVLDAIVTREQEMNERDRANPIEASS